MPPGNPMLNSWQTVDAIPALLNEEVHVWRIELSVRATVFEACYALLTPEEIARSKRLRKSQAREQFIVGRGALRQILGAITGIDPRQLYLVAARGGKPGLAGSDIAFNVAHSGNTVLIAVRLRGVLGVDVERIEPAMRFAEVAEHSFAAVENLWLAGIHDPEERRRVFYQLWTRKEAVAKADGRGLALPFRSFEVALSASERAAVTMERDAGGQSFWVMDLPLGNEMAGTLATDSPVGEMKLLVFPPYEVR